MSQATIPADLTDLTVTVEESAEQQPDRLAVLERFVTKLLTLKHVYDYSDGLPALIIDGDHGAGIRLQLDHDEWSLLWAHLDPSEEARQ